ncbi:MAG: ABC transporter permease [Spirochaetes bacterium]|nr:ABC transporter permease [Spirochaetota bacterium]
MIDFFKDFFTINATENSAIDISFLELGLMYLILLIPLLIMFKLKINLFKQVFISILRMSVQLVFVGFYLQFIFDLNLVWLNLIWVLIMMVVANLSILDSTRLKKQIFFMPLFLGMIIGSGLTIAIFVFLVVRPKPFYDARYLIPLSGMILGNCLRGNIISLERFYATLLKKKDEYLAYLMMGATKMEALAPYLKESISAAMLPTISTMATIGLVALPGMMTGQILGGSSPLTAIKYQIAIMISIYTAVSFASTLNVVFSIKFAFDDYHNLKLGILKEK